MAPPLVTQRRPRPRDSFRGQPSQRSAQHATDSTPTRCSLTPHPRRRRRRRHQCRRCPHHPMSRSTLGGSQASGFAHPPSAQKAPAAAQRSHPRSRPHSRRSRSRSRSRRRVCGGGSVGPCSCQWHLPSTLRAPAARSVWAVSRATLCALPPHRRRQRRDRDECPPRWQTRLPSLLTPPRHPKRLRSQPRARPSAQPQQGPKSTNGPPRSWEAPSRTSALGDQTLWSRATQRGSCSGDADAAIATATATGCEPPLLPRRRSIQRPPRSPPRTR